MNLTNKVIIVTGATSGIGYEIGKQALDLGAKVMFHCSFRSFKKTEELVSKLGESASCVAADLSSIDSCKIIVEKTIEVFGQVDGLVNNAAIFPRNNILDLKEEDYNSIFNVNVKSPLFLIQEVVKIFDAQDIKGSIVNIGSINAYCGQSDLLAYSISKGAMMTMTRNLADSLCCKGIRINQINVGWTHTDKENTTQINEGNGENWYKNINKNFAPRGTLLAPSEVAKHVVFWLSDFSRPVSGSIYEVEQYPVIGRNKINE